LLEATPGWNPNWAALGNIGQVRQPFDQIKPFDECCIRVEDVSGWDECTQVLNRWKKLEAMRKGRVG